MVTYADFPGCAERYYLDVSSTAADRDIHITAKEGYRYSGVVRFSTSIGNNPDYTDSNHHNYTDLGGGWNGASYVWNDNGLVPDTDYQNAYLLKASADVNFYDLAGNKIYTADSPKDLSQHFNSPDSFANDATVTRKYQSLLFNSAGVATAAEQPLTMRETTSPADRAEPVGLGSVGFDIDPVVDGASADPVTGDSAGRFIYRDGAYYGFLGWMCPQNLSAEEMAHAFVDSKPTLGSAGYVATSAANAVPYLLTERTRVEHAMEIHPVYAKFDIETTTNVARAGVPAGSGINVPLDPTYTVAPDGNGTFSVNLEADITTKVGQGTEETYRLTGFMVEREDGSVETLAPIAADPGNAFSYTVRPGERYVFVAYYEPLAVSYHVSDADVSVVVKNKGETLGEAPAHKFDLSAIDGAAGSRVVFAGWTETRPDAGSYVLVEAADQVKLVKPSTAVERCMELFPVFRKAAATVDSNIDDVLTQSGTDLTTVRDIVRTPEGALMLKASAPEGYQFVGWYKDYVSDAEKGTLVSGGSMYALSSSALLTPTRYTAVFQQVHEIRYHDTQGGVIYTARAAHDSGRTFVTSQTDDAGQTVDVLEDVEAWQEIIEVLEAQSAAPDAPMQELIYKWQWVKADGSIVAWEDFCRQPIAEDMDLYPITRQVSSHDAAGEENTQDLYWALDSRSDVPVKAYFKQAYAQSKLTVHVDEAAYAPAADGKAQADLSPVPDRNVGLHASALQGEPWVKATDAQGDAVFEFESGAIVLTKQTTDPHAAGATFSFKVTELMPGATRAVTVTLPETAAADGVYRASVTLDVPVGRYRITEDASWAWRYETQLASGSVVAAAQTPAGAIDVDVMGDKVQVECTNTLAQDAWLDASAHKKNEFAAQGGGA